MYFQKAWWTLSTPISTNMNRFQGLAVKSQSMTSNLFSVMA